MSFDPWGERQLADWATGDPANGDPDHYPTTRGFTGHEHLEQVDLIHMNGRVYDPVIGRFLSPDLLIQAPFNTQSFNRYSYVFNNPLSYTDPSGYQACYTGVEDGRGGSIRGMTDCPDLMGDYAGYFMQFLEFANNGGYSGSYNMGNVNANNANPGATSSMLGDSSGYTPISTSGGHPVNTVVGAALFLLDAVSGGGKTTALKEAIDTTNDVKKAGQKLEKALDTSQDVTKRPGSFRKGTLTKNWDSAADGTKPGSKQCPKCDKDVFGNPHNNERRNGTDGWDNHHDPKWKDRDLSGMDRDRVLDEYNKDTSLLCQHCNRSDNQ